MHRTLTRTALILALTLIFQGLRLVIPLPPFISVFIIGSLVNSCLLIAASIVGWRSAALISVATPVVAYLQQMLPLPVFIIPVAFGGLLYIGLFLMASNWHKWGRIALAASGKALFMFLTFSWLLTFLQIPPKMAAGLMVIMSWPQVITGLVGGTIALLVSERLKD